MTKPVLPKKVDTEKSTDKRMITLLTEALSASKKGDDATVTQNIGVVLSILKNEKD